MRLYLIRHGRQCSRLCNVDVGLSREGYRQATLVGERLLSANIQALYSSHLLRAVETAKTANLCWKAEHVIKPELREISFGAMEGMCDADIALQFKEFKMRQALMEEDLPYPQGECAADVIRRAQPVFEEMVKSGYERIAVVTHGGVIRSMAAHYLSIPLNKWRVLGKDLENCSITELIWDEKKETFLLERFNDYAHLEPYPELLRAAWLETEN